MKEGIVKSVMCLILLGSIDVLRENGKGDRGEMVSLL